MTTQKQFIESKLQQFNDEFVYNNQGKRYLYNDEKLEPDMKNFIATALKEIVEETRDEIGRAIIRLSNERGDEVEIAMNDILNYALRLKKLFKDGIGLDKM